MGMRKRVFLLPGTESVCSSFYVGSTPSPGIKYVVKKNNAGHRFPYIQPMSKCTVFYSSPRRSTDTSLYMKRLERNDIISTKLLCQMAILIML